MPTTLTRRPRAKLKSTSVVGKSATYGGIGNDAVKAATGKNWSEWCKVIDKAGGAKMTHKQIVALVHERHKVGSWWQQMVTVGYEQKRGLREKHQKPGGYEVSASKTLNTNATKAYMWWTVERCRMKWLAGADIAIHKRTPGKSLRVTWNASTSKPAKSISVNLYPKGTDRTTMTIQHGKLASAAEAKNMKAYWSARLDRLQQLVAEQPNGR